MLKTMAFFRISVSVFVLKIYGLGVYPGHLDILDITDFVMVLEILFYPIKFFDDNETDSSTT